MGAYDRMLDWCYSNNRLLPLDYLQVQRICKAISPSDLKAVDDVLHEFWKKTPDGWFNKKVAEELKKRKLISEKRASAQAKSVEARRAKNSFANALANANTSTSIGIQESIPPLTGNSVGEVLRKMGGGTGRGSGNTFSIRQWMGVNPEGESEIMLYLTRSMPGKDRMKLLEEYDNTAHLRGGIPSNPVKAFCGWAYKFHGPRKR